MEKISFTTSKNLQLNNNHSFSQDPSCLDFLLSRDTPINEIYIKIKNLRKQIFSHFLQPGATLEHKFYASALATLDFCKKIHIGSPHVYIEVCTIEALLQEQTNLKAAYDKVRKQIISLQLLEPKDLPAEARYGQVRIEEIFSAACQKEKALRSAELRPVNTLSLNEIRHQLPTSASIREFAENTEEWARLSLSAFFQSTISEATRNFLAKTEPRFLMGNFESFTSYIPSLEIGDSFDNLSLALHDQHQMKQYSAKREREEPVSPPSNKKQKTSIEMTERQKECVEKIKENASAFASLAESLSPGKSFEFPVGVLGGKSLSKQELLIKALELNPSGARACYLLANTLRTGGSAPLWGKSMSKQQLYVKALELDPPDARACYLLASTLPTEGSAPLGGISMSRQQLYVKAIELDSSSPQAAQYFNNLANTLKTDQPYIFPSNVLGGISMSQQELYVKAIELDSTSPDAALYFRNLASTLKTDQPYIFPPNVLGGISMSQQELLVKAIALDPSYAGAYNALARLLPLGGSVAVSGKSMSEQELLVKAIEMRPPFARAYHNLACLLPLGGSAPLGDISMSQDQLLVKAIGVLEPSSARARYFCSLADTLKAGKSYKFPPKCSRRHMTSRNNCSSLKPSNSIPRYASDIVAGGHIESRQVLQISAQCSRRHHHVQTRAYQQISGIGEALGTSDN